MREHENETFLILFYSVIVVSVCRFVDVSLVRVKWKFKELFKFVAFF